MNPRHCRIRPRRGDRRNASSARFRSIRSYKDWKATGVENNVFKLMLFLLGFGAILAILGRAQRRRLQPAERERDAMIVRDDEYLDFSNVPESRGIPHRLYRVALIGLLIIFAIGASVCLLSGYGHHWPSDTTMRAPLNGSAQ